MFNMVVVIIWLIAGVLTMATMAKMDSPALKFNYVTTWIVLMVNLIAKCFEV